MRLIAASIAALALAVTVTVGSVVIAQALEEQTAYEIDSIRDACADAHPGNISLCFLDTLDRGP